MNDEFQFIRYIKEFFNSELIGDDAAVIRNNQESILITKDILIEDIHFKINDNLFKIGAKSLISNISDIIAMGGIPLHFFLGLGIPEHLNNGNIRKLLTGIKSISEKYNLKLSGGDISKSPKPLFISITVLGEVINKAITRDSAEIDDDIWVTGFLGDSEIGLQLILNKIQIENKSLNDYFISRHYIKNLHLKFISSLVQNNLINSMIDVSDGFLQDLSHILKCSEKSAEIFTDKIPVSNEFQKLKYILGNDFCKIPLISGEEYELIFTTPEKNRGKIIEFSEQYSCRITNIGKIIKQSKKLIEFKNTEQTGFKFENFDKLGYKHF